MLLAPPVIRQEGLPWRRGLAWLLFLGPFFFLSYGFANWWTATQAVPGTVVFAWEHHIPFMPWTIVPYWTIDLLYGFSFLLCRDRRAVDTHAFRLLTAQIVCIACFIAFPLRFSFERPVTDGVFGGLFELLAGFDQPFNQAPSLHIVLLIILWARYAEASQGFWRLLTHSWAVLIGLSVLTTYQHHFIDLPTGALVGLLCVWLWPDDSSALPRQWRFTSSPAARRIGVRYLLGALSCTLVACLGGFALCLLWPAVALGLVALIYLGLGVAGFAKRDGRLGFASAWLMAPYIAAAWINSRWWTRRHPAPVEIADGVWLGRLPRRSEMQDMRFAALLDLTAEFSTPKGDWASASLPWLDLLPPSTPDLRLAADAIERLREHGPLLVSCALGYSRSAVAVAGWLLRTGRVASVADAVTMISAQRPQIVLGPAHQAALAALLPAEEA